MWTEIFKERIRKEKLEQKKIIELMGISEPAFYAGIKKETFKFQNILKIYKHFDWDLNELKAEDENIINEATTYYNRIVSTDKNNSQQLENLQRIYENHIQSLRSEIENQQGQISFLQKIIEKDMGTQGAKTSCG